MNNNFKTIALVFLASVILMILASRVRIAESADSVTVLRTSGMTCVSCSDKITKALNSEKGVATTEIDVEGGWVIVGYDTTKTEPSRIAEKVTNSGFSSNVYTVLSPDQFKQITGRDLGSEKRRQGCCGNKSGNCSAGNKS